MVRYEIFKRTWWRLNKAYPGGLEPHMGRKTHVGYVYGMEAAVNKCEAFNSTEEVTRNKLGLKYEFKQS